MNEAGLWLSGLATLPILVLTASCLPIDVERLRRLAVISAVSMLVMALGIAFSPPLHAVSIRTEALSWIPGGEALIRIDTLTAVLLPFTAALWLLSVAVIPGRRSTYVACAGRPSPP